jgi:hypothetical protein
LRSCEAFEFPFAIGESERWIRLSEVRKRWRTGSVFLILFWILLFTASLSLLAILLIPFFNIYPPSQSILTLDWAGYVAASDLASPQPQVIGVNSSWNVPKVIVSVEDSFSAVWIGIGGEFDNTLIQVGTEQDSINGQGEYFVWYEVLPKDSVTIATMNVSPEDVITASINLVNSDANEWAIQIYDVTNGQGFNQNFVYNSSRLSADWIVERPTVNNRLGTLADFGSVAFTGSHVKLNANVGTIKSFPFSRFTLNSRQNVQLTTVSSLSPDGSSFTVDYLTSG